MVIKHLRINQRNMSYNNVRDYLSKYDKEKYIIKLADSTATSDLAAKSLSVYIGQIAKTVSFERKNEETCILIVMSGDKRIDNKKFKEKFGFKPQILSHDKVEVLTGHPIGGVCPFANPQTVSTYLDISLQTYETVYVACGDSNSVIELTNKELFDLSNAIEWVDINI